MTDRKKTGVPFWATVVLVVVLGYPLSFGPACWLVDREILPWHATRTFYDPLLLVIVRSPKPAQQAVTEYCALLHPPNPIFGSSGSWWIRTDKQYRLSKK